VSEFVDQAAHMQKAEAVTDRPLDFSTFLTSRECIEYRDPFWQSNSRDPPDSTPAGFACEALPERLMLRSRDKRGVRTWRLER
jgi:hypothetical protein